MQYFSLCEILHKAVKSRFIFGVKILIVACVWIVGRRFETGANGVSFSPLFFFSFMGYDFSRCFNIMEIIEMWLLSGH